jgi:WD40 repeat protein
VPAPAEVSAKFAPDGMTVALSCVRTTQQPSATAARAGLRLVDVKSQRVILSAPPSDVYRFVLDGKVLAATEGVGRFLRFWDADSGKLLHESGVTGPVIGLSSQLFSVETYGHRRTGTLRALRRYLPWDPGKDGWDDNDISIHNVATKQKIAAFTTPGVCQITFSPDGTLLASSRSNGVIEVWQMPPRSPLWPTVGLGAAFVLIAVCLRIGYGRLRKKGVAKSPA